MSSGVRDSRNLSGCSVLTHSDNRRLCGVAFGYAQISPYGETSHIPRTLYAIESLKIK
jgi:hypothetical protein